MEANPPEKPVWMERGSLNEVRFYQEFLKRRQLIYANGAFFTPEGRMTDDLPLRSEIYEAREAPLLQRCHGCHRREIQSGILQQCDQRRRSAGAGICGHRGSR